MMQTANIEQCKNYLIQLFYKTDQRYSCTRTKIAKLLSILAFKYAVKDIKLFVEDIYRYPQCGTTIAEIMWFTDRDIYMRFTYQDSQKRIHKYELKDKVHIPKKYENTSELSLELKKDIEDLFFNFGAFSQADLADLLNPIVEIGGVCYDDGTVNLNTISCLDKDWFPNNKVVKYIFK